MRTMIVVSAFVLLPALSCGEETVQAFDFAESGGRVVFRNDGGPRTLKVLSLENPGIRRARYALRGDVSYESVQGDSYLEMWSTFPKGRFFSRTLEASGPMGRLSGSSPARAFLLPFFAEPGGALPSEVSLNVVLAGAGTVTLEHVRLVQFEDDENPLAVAGAWWDGRTAGLVGGLAGSVIGCLGGLIGTLAGLGKARRIAIVGLKTMLAFGLVCLVLGVVALVRSQPYEVFYPLLLLGLVCATLPLFLIGTVRRRYEELELRRMRAQDAR